MHLKILSGKWTVVARPQYEKNGRSKQTKYYRLFSEDKVFVFRLKLHWHIFCWVLMTNYAQLAHVGQWYIQEYGQILTYLDPI